jgi:tetratricopeptide (TPR) repeat protein
VTLTVAMVALTLRAAPAAEDAVGRAMKQYERRQYEEAARALQAERASLPPARQSAAHLTLGMLYLKMAELHRALHRVGKTAQLEYLTRLAAARGPGGSRFADLYLGQTLVQNGSPGEAAKHLERFLAQAGVESRYKGVARVSLGLSYFLRKDLQKAQALWGSPEAADAEVKTELAAAYSAAGLVDRHPFILVETALRRARSEPSPRMRNNVLAVYVRAGLTDKGLDLLRLADLKAASYTEVLGKTKTINFYDVSLLGDLATLYGQASLAYLEKAAADAALKPTADYYLGEGYAEAGSLEPSLRALAAFLSLPSAPPAYRDRARVRQAAGQYLQGRRAEAMAVWVELAQPRPPDPDLLAEIVSACVRVNADCPEIVAQATRAAEAGEGRRFTSLNFALGRHFLRKQEHGAALTYMEVGRDKSHKNKIEANEPVMLVVLADLYYRSKKFSESLEIYFEMGKQFPAVRQIQEALQGIYSMEHQSAGDVKIF